MQVRARDNWIFILAALDLLVVISLVQIAPVVLQKRVLFKHYNTAIFGVLFLGILYIYDLYSLFRPVFVKYFINALISICTFGIVVVVQQYAFYYQLLFGRTILIFVLATLLVYLMIRWFLVRTYSKKLTKGVYILSPSQNAEEIVDADDFIKDILHAEGYFEYKGTSSIVNGVLTNKDNRHISLKDSFFLILDINNFDIHNVKQLVNFKLKGVSVYSIENFYEKYFGKIPVVNVNDQWFILNTGFEQIFSMFYKKIKRVMDILISLSGIVLTSPIMLVAAIMIKLESPGSILFTQTRSGQGGALFTIYKFRSMRQDAEKNGATWASKGDARATHIGRFLRKTRIDELPQFFNILNGDMSFIGPRPERPEFDVSLEREIDHYNLRYLVKPGLTGWAQVHYPYGASIYDARQKLMYDLYYIKNYSFFLDILILLKTVRVIIRGMGR